MGAQVLRSTTTLNRFIREGQMYFLGRHSFTVIVSIWSLKSYSNPAHHAVLIASCSIIVKRAHRQISAGTSVQLFKERFPIQMCQDYLRTLWECSSAHLLNLCTCIPFSLLQATRVIQVFYDDDEDNDDE